MLPDFLEAHPHLREILGQSLPIAELGPGRPQEWLRSRLDALDDQELFAGAKVSNATLAQCCRSGLWLAFDFLEESHELSQAIPTEEGSYWHGIMHRREPDYDNAKYWFRRVPRHAIFSPLGAAAAEIAAQQTSTDPHAAFLRHQHDWDAMAFVDLCAAVARGKSQSGELARAVAMAEWQLLFAFCYHGAIR